MCKEAEMEGDSKKVPERGQGDDGELLEWIVPSKDFIRRRVLCEELQYIQNNQGWC